MQPPVMEAIQAMWDKELGVHATLATLEQKTWIQNQQTLNYDGLHGGLGGRFPRPGHLPRPLRHGRRQQLDGLGRRRL